jgi:hypothetical protein
MTAIIGLVLLLLILPILAFLTLRLQSGEMSASLRPLPGTDELPGSVGRSAESGQPLHVSVGISGVGGQATSETWAGLTVLAQLADDAAACSTPLIVSVADPTVLPLAQDILRRAYARHGNLADYDLTQVRFIAPEPTAYAAGVMGILEREPLTSNIMVGAFGDEYLLMGEVGARRQVRQMVGAADPRTLPFAEATADELLVGEEMFAGGAYTSRLPVQIASLLTEDWLRWGVVAAILITAVVKIIL